jgi:hypothetical protein
MPIAAVVEAPHDPEGSTRSRSGAGASGIHEGGGEEGNSMQKQRLFCVHAGLSPALDDLSALRKIRRPCKVHSDQVRRTAEPPPSCRLTHLQVRLSGFHFF